MEESRMKYLWIKTVWIKTGNLDGYSKGDRIMIIDDPVKLFKSGEFNEETDTLFQIGNEVKLKVELQPVSSKRSEDLVRQHFNRAFSLTANGSHPEYEGLRDAYGHPIDELGRQ
jgi:hypothetical protein